MPEVAPTRSAAMGLAEERTLMRQGFGFLDEKRMLLATEILRLVRRVEALAEEMAALRRAAAAALAAAVERHGLDALQVYPAPAVGPSPSPLGHVKFMGVPVKACAPWRITPAAAPAALDASEEAVACRVAFERWLETTQEAGALAANLERLGREYRRVERRAKALENVLLPEVEASLKQVVEQLDVMDQEEAVRVRTAGAQRGADNS
jgi:V/A-type H+/Na+-transporting ATPase subunit D